MPLPNPIPPGTTILINTTVTIVEDDGLSEAVLCDIPTGYSGEMKRTLIPRATLEAVFVQTVPDGG